MPAYVEMLAHLSNDQWLELVRWRLGHPSAESLQTYLEAVNSVHSNPFLQAEQAELTNMVERAVGKSKGFKKGGDRLDEVLAMATWSGHALLERHRLPDQTLKTVWEPLETLIPLDSVLALDQFHYSTDYGPNTENVGRFIYGLLCLSGDQVLHVGAEERYEARIETRVRQAADALVGISEQLERRAWSRAATLDGADAVLYAARTINMTPPPASAEVDVSAYADALRNDQVSQVAALKQAVSRGGVATAVVANMDAVQTPIAELLFLPFKGTLDVTDFLPRLASG